jgi:hypothetical protein
MSDHNSSSSAVAEPAIDLTDFYVFFSPSRPVRDGLVGRPKHSGVNRS